MNTIATTGRGWRRPPSYPLIALHQGHWLALIGWSAAALKCKVRDRWIGWPPLLQWRRLALVANNTRLLLLPHIRIPNLASRILALNLKRLSGDWEKIYGHRVPIWVLAGGDLC